MGVKISVGTQIVAQELAGAIGIFSPAQALWHYTFHQVAYDLKKIMRQDQEAWEPIDPKRRKGKGRRLRAM